MQHAEIGIEASEGSGAKAETQGDASLQALVALLALNGLPADSAQLRHEAGHQERLSPADLIRLARRRELRAKEVTVAWDRVAMIALPAIAVLKDGSCALLVRAAADRILMVDPDSGRPTVLGRAEFEVRWTGRLILATKRLGLSDLGRRFDLGWFLSAMHKYRRLLGEVLVASLFLQIFALVSPLFFQVVVDKVLVHRGISTLDVLVIGLVVVSCFESLLSVLRTHVFSHTTNRIDVELGARLFRHLMALPLAYFANRRVGDSVARVRELENIRNFLTGSALTLVVDLVFTVVFLAVMLAYSPLLTLVVALSLPLYAIISAGVGPLFRRRLEEKFRRGSENQAFLVEAVGGAETVKAMAVEPQLQRRWENQLAEYVHAAFRVTSLGNVASQSIQLISKLVSAAILYFGAGAVMAGKMTVGELVAFNMLAGRVSQPVLRLAQVWQDFHQARLSVERLGDILNTPTEPQASPGQAALPGIKGEVVFDHVRFRYRPDTPAMLEDLSLTVAAGQSIGIVGPSGSGKSTLTKLLQRLYVPEAGRVLVDGVDIAQIDASWLRRQIGVVLQENVLLAGTIRENIALADPAMPLDKVMRAARMAGAHDFILGLPQGYDTVVGERGASLSGGQRQRVAIARALVTDPRILIFDEATSALDYESERVVQENLAEMCRGRTVFIVAHRLSAVRHCDRIVTLEKGRLVEAGSHEELVRAGGRYAMLHRLQGGLHGVG
ncbi:subfamily B ATP-binding cassette protein HlyB/CyaB [Nitrospirillum amazonense]|uniref:Subfamily B ATP-binding cassette protein HlyB/CyaB n=1 Tax=Nitrospirillum amazonense TaxID=28077 RepID=A0A560EI93_9PROT|nr:subfamily B ATP-binding cassette protein HlyB/CyaB [Nitrospirillum amazonense]